MDKDPKKTEKKNSPMFKKKVVKKVKNEFEDEDFIKKVGKEDFSKTTEVETVGAKRKGNNKVTLKKRKGKKI